VIPSAYAYLGSIFSNSTGSLAFYEKIPMYIPNILSKTTMRNARPVFPTYLSPTRLIEINVTNKIVP
jgi:hypothetical protein